jgi:urease accessory protein
MVKLVPGTVTAAPKSKLTMAEACNARDVGSVGSTSSVRDTRSTRSANTARSSWPLYQSMLPLYQAFDALFPIGAYAFSDGMEAYTQLGLVHDRDTLGVYLKARLLVLPFADLGIAAQAAVGLDFVTLDHLSSAMKQAFEVRTGSNKLCARFIKAHAGTGSLSDYPHLSAYQQAIASGQCEGHYPVAAGLLVSDLRVDPHHGLELYCYSLVTALVNQAVKLVPLGPTDGQLVLSETLTLIPLAVDTALAASIDELGVSGAGFELRAMQHEQLTGRLYSS